MQENTKLIEQIFEIDPRVLETAEDPAHLQNIIKLGKEQILKFVESKIQVDISDILIEGSPKKRIRITAIL